MGSSAGPDGECELHAVDEAAMAAVRARMLPASVVAGLASTFQALGDPTRVRLIHALSQCELCVCDLASLLGLTVSAVSHQLRLLRSLRVVRTRREGRRIYYALDDEHVRTLFAQALAHGEHAAAGATESQEKRSGGEEESAAAGVAVRR